MIAALALADEGHGDLPLVAGAVRHLHRDPDHDVLLAGGRDGALGGLLDLEDDLAGAVDGRAGGQLDLGLDEVGLDGRPEGERDAAAGDIGADHHERRRERRDRHEAVVDDGVEQRPVEPLDGAVEPEPEGGLPAVEGREPRLPPGLARGALPRGGEVGGQDEQALDQRDRENRDDHRGKDHEKAPVLARDEEQGQEGDDVGGHREDDRQGHLPDPRDGGGLP